MIRAKMLISSSALSIGMIASGCLTEQSGPIEETMSNDDLVAPPQSTSVEASVVDGTLNLGPTFTEWALSPHGGSGGGFTGHVTPSAIIYGVRVKAGYLVDSISFAWYQPTRFDNLFQSGNRWDPNPPTYGGSGGFDYGWWYCPAGKGVIGIVGNTGDLVDRIGVICGDVSNPDPSDPLNSPSPLWGGGGGGWFGEDKCAPGRIVDSFNVRSGAYLDNLQAICINAH